MAALRKEGADCAISINAFRDRGIFRAMYQTYELYLHEAGGYRRFRPVTCQSPLQAMKTARELLEEEQELSSIEVRMSGEHLFTLER